jgi:membrane protease YdiL (CAAX protease family)
VNSPSTFRVVLLVSALSLRRLLNRISHLRARGRKGPGGRTATARKATGGKLLLAFMAAAFVFQSATVTVTLLRNTAAAAERADNPGFLLVRDETLELIDWVQRVRQIDPASDAVNMEKLRGAFSYECSMADAAARAACQRELEHAFEKRGSAAFRASVVPSMAVLPEPELWYRGGSPGPMLSPLALIAILLGITVALQHLAADRDLAKVDTGLEWLFSFPVPARALFLSRALEAALVGPLVLVTIWPFYAMIFWCAGYGAGGILLGAGAALYTGALAGCVRVVLETTLRRFLTLAAVARVQSVLLVSSYVALVASFALASSTRVSRLMSWANDLPAWALFAPPSLPLWLAFGGRTAWLTALAMLGLLCVVLALSVSLAEHMVRDGVTSGSGNLVASRRAARRSATGSSGFLQGVALKELRAVFRDRQLRAQALITPVVLVGLQLWLNPAILDGVLGNPRHVATAAFALAMLVMASGASGALATEGPALWLLYTVPQRIERSLVAKLLVWVLLASLFSAAVLGLVGVRSPSLLLASLPYLALVIPGIGLYAVIAFGLGTLGTDPLEAEPRKRIRVGAVYLFMILASMFSYALYVPSRWAKLVQLVLSGLLSLALWQKVKDHAPFLLDPTEAPPPRIAVADGVMAALGFFVMQGVLQLASLRFDLPPGQALLVAFVGAGSVVALVALLLFQQSGVPDLLRTVGLRLPRGSTWLSVARALALGIGTGLVAAVVGLAYLWLCQRVEFLRQLRDESLRLSAGEATAGLRWWIFGLAVFAAPLFEEFIFRGVLFHGMRRSLGAGGAALGSAAVFALVHPVVAAAPVFVLALLSALAYERSRWLATPVLSHMVYNTAMVGAALAQP